MKKFNVFFLSIVILIFCNQCGSISESVHTIIGPIIDSVIVNTESDTIITGFEDNTWIIYEIMPEIFTADSCDSCLI